MYLARVEMTGFKSFADKTVIEFDKGMTAVVGPNGSGKSNLSEAIRWVLGEQSAKSLRGHKMEDVIFNGTQNRKAVNFARVTLVLNNEDRYLDYDFNEISITRSYNRNGDSQYFINNEVVRLKDIVDLLLDSGLGKNSFAMISQGKVESIFLSKPEERRAIFEEAAGVQKYQYRKLEAERKLLKSSDHLSRVRDIIHELSQQLKPLKRQRDAAIQYLEQKEALTQLEIALYCYQIDQYKEAWESSRQQLTQVEQELSVLQAQSETLQTTLQHEEQQLDTLIQQLDKLSEHSQVEVQQLEQMRGQIQILEQQIQFNTSNLAEKTMTYEQQVEQHRQLQQQIESLQLSEQNLKVEVSTLSQHLQELTSERDRLSANTDEMMSDLRNQLIDVYQSEATANNQVKQAEQMIAQQSIRQEKYQTQYTQIEREQQQLQEQKVQQEVLLKQINQQAEQSAQALQQEQETIVQLQVQRETMQQEMFQVERQLQLLEGKVQSLNQLHEEYAGYYGGVKAVMKYSRQTAGIEGTVADFMQVPQRYQIAIDTALGATLQHIVVKNDQVARQAIQYLKQQQAGRATFLPRTAIRGRQVPAQQIQIAQQQEGFLGIASDLVQYQPNDEAIIRHVLGTTFVCKQIEQAQALARQLQYQIKVVTLDGEVLMPGGSITGGRQKQQGPSLLGRQRELKEAQKSLEKVRSQKLTYNQKWQDLQAIFQTKQAMLQTLQDQAQRTTTEVQEYQQKLYSTQQQLAKLEHSHFILSDELLQVELSLQSNREQLKQASQQGQAAREKIASLNQQLEKLTMSAEDRQQQLQVLEGSIAHYTTQEAVKKLEFKQVAQQLTKERQQFNELETFMAQYQLFEHQQSSDLSELEQSLQTLVAKVLEQEVTVKQEQETLSLLREQRTQRQQLIRETEQAMREVQKQVQQFVKQQLGHQAQIEKYDSLIESHLTYLSQEYQLSYEAAKHQAIPLENVSQVAQQVKTMKQSINLLGPINLAAIEDYEQLDERYQHLTTQEQDLLTAMEHLQRTMDEMDAEVEKRFKEAFEQINRQFQKTFKRLFAGGEAALQLTDPKDLLTTGIDIIAQPPGKRKQHLALLSGGERAFTAIALLFAILETRPVPFCILDEVEAALDDANVYRYGQYLQNFTENTQFIVITHRKGTMEHADVLYGVTMERSGISKLASVRLSEALEV